MLLNGSFSHNRRHHARQCKLKFNLQDIFLRQTYASDKEIQDFLTEYLPKRPEKTHPLAVQNLFAEKPSFSFDDSDDCSESSSESDPDGSDSDASEDL